MKTTSWNEIKPLVQKLNPKFYAVIEAAKPHPNLTMYLFDYNYGQHMCDGHTFYYSDGQPFIQSCQHLPPMLVLEGLVEVYSETLLHAMPWNILKPGQLFPMTQYTPEIIEKRFAPSANFKLTAGTRNTFILQLHSMNEYYARLKKHYRLANEHKPTNPLDHYKILGEIARKENSSWKTRILVFGNEWLQHIWENPQWLEVRLYFYQEMLQRASPWQWSVICKQTMRDITHAHRFKLKDYTANMIEQIIFTAAGGIPAFIPAYDESALPLHTLASAFNQFYGDHNLPVIMYACHSDILGETKYLSISQNSAIPYDIKTYRPLTYLYEVKEYLPQYLQYLQTELMTKNTVYGQLHSRLHIDYYSEKGIAEEGILPARDLQHDPRINTAYQQYYRHADQSFPERAPFLKAFVGFTFT